MRYDPVGRPENLAKSSVIFHTRNAPLSLCSRMALGLSATDGLVEPLSALRAPLELDFDPVFVFALRRRSLLSMARLSLRRFFCAFSMADPGGNQSAGFLSFRSSTHASQSHCTQKSMISDQTLSGGFVKLIKTTLPPRV